MDELLEILYLNSIIIFSSTTLVYQYLGSLWRLEKGRYPIWVQETEWPAYEGRPMQYVSRKRVGDSDLVLFTFRDVETGKTRVVEQYY